LPNKILFVENLPVEVTGACYVSCVCLACATHPFFSRAHHPFFRSVSCRHELRTTLIFNLSIHSITNSLCLPCAVLLQRPPFQLLSLQLSWIC
jgi:hypothetical protein